MNEAASPESGNWLADLLVRYERPLLKYAHGVCSDRELSRDVVQETFFRLIRMREKAMPDNVGAWLFTVCRNVATDHLRRQRRIQFHWELPDVEADDATSPADRLARDERSSRLAAMVDSLPERERELVRLKFQAGLSYREIEEITGISQGNIGYFLHRAVKDLKDRWEREGGDA